MALDRKELGKRLQACREASGLTQPDVIAKIGVKEFQTVSKWERGVNRPSIDNLSKLAELYGQPLSYFLEGDDPHRVAHAEIRAKIAEQKASTPKTESQLTSMILDQHEEIKSIEGQLALAKAMIPNEAEQLLLNAYRRANGVQQEIVRATLFPKPKSKYEDLISHIGTEGLSETTLGLLKIMGDTIAPLGEMITRQSQTLSDAPSSEQHKTQQNAQPHQNAATSKKAR